MYTWTEDEFRKDSSACVSAVFHALKGADMTGIETVRLCADACGGQNKNCALLYMAGHWLTQYAAANVKTVELVFPVRVHTFLPCDRVFGVTEKKLRKIEKIYSPDEYIEVYKAQGTVLKANSDWKVLNFKDAADKMLKKPLPVKIQENKRFFVIRGNANVAKIAGEPHYYNRLNTAQTVTKKGKHFAFSPHEIPIGVPVSELKKRDIIKLLEHVGNDYSSWPVLWQLQILMCFQTIILILTVSVTVWKRMPHQ